MKYLLSEKRLALSDDDFEYLLKNKSLRTRKRYYAERKRYQIDKGIALRNNIAVSGRNEKSLTRWQKEEKQRRRQIWLVGIKQSIVITKHKDENSRFELVEKNLEKLWYNYHICGDGEDIFYKMRIFGELDIFNESGKRINDRRTKFGGIISTNGRLERKNLIDQFISYLIAVLYSQSVKFIKLYIYGWKFYAHKVKIENKSY